MIYRRFLNIALACALLGAGAVRGSDSEVLAAHEAFRAGDAERLERHARALQGEVLEPWAEYWRLRLLIEDAQPVEVTPYLARHAGTYLAEQMRADWLRELGRREDWPLFERELGPLVQDDLEIRCHAWHARLARGDAQAAIEARTIWQELRELPEGCQRLADRLLAEGAVREDDLWQRTRLQIYYGYVTAARRTLENLPAAARPDERLLTRAVTDPRLLVERAAGNLESRPSREVLVFALLRQSRRDVDVSVRSLRAGAGARLPQADRE
jgi:soluble lytic murein transglycosylase